MLNDFIEYLKAQIGQPYLWGGQHTKLTLENYVATIKKKEANRGGYKDGQTYAEAVIAFCKKKFDKGATVLYGYDCSGLGTYWLYNLQHLYKSDVKANTMMSRCVDVTDAEPPEKGWWVFRLSGNRATHIGYMIDNEYLIEAKGRKYGVVKTKWNADDWDCWGVPEVFEDDIFESDDQFEDDNTDDEYFEPEENVEDPEVDEVEEQPKEYMVKVLKGTVYVRKTDEIVNGKPVGKILFTSRKGNRFNLIGISETTGWYHIDTYKGPAYISNRSDLTALIEK